MATDTGKEIVLHFKEFTGRRNRSNSSTPVAAIHIGGNLNFNKALKDLLGNPTHLTVHFDEDNRVIGLLPATESVPNAYPIRPQKATSDAQFYISIVAFLKGYGIPVTERHHFYYPRKVDGFVSLFMDEADVKDGDKRIVVEDEDERVAD